MDTILQAMLAFGTLSGWVTAICGVTWFISSQRRQLQESRRVASRQRRVLLNARSEFRTLERRLRKQLEQTAILGMIETVMAERLAEIEGGAARTKKSEARVRAVKRLGTGTAFDKSITSRTGVQGELQRLDDLVANVDRILDAEQAEDVAEMPTESAPPMIAA